MTAEPSLVIEDADGNRYDDGSVAWGNGVWGDFVWGGGGTLEQAKIDQLLETRVTREPTAVSEARVTLPAQDYQTLRDEWVRPDTTAYLYVGDELLYRGFLTTSDARKSAGEVTFTIPDTVEQLNRGEQVVTYTNIPTWEAIDDYGNTYTDFQWNVAPPSPTQIRDDFSVLSIDTQTEWGNNTSLAATDPAQVDAGFLKMEPTADAQDALDDATLSNVGFVNGDEWNDGQAAQISTDPASIEFTVNLPYDLPESAVGIGMREHAVTDVNLEYRFDGTIIDTSSLASGVRAWNFRGQASETGVEGGYAGAIGGTLSAGAHTFSIETNGTTSEYILDVIALFDRRYYDDTSSVDFPDPDAATNGGGLLAGPATFSDDGVTVSLNQYNDGTANITSATVDSTWDDTTGAQAISLSNDNRTTFETLSNTADGTVSFDNSFGTTLDVDITLSGYGTQTNYPTANPNGQQVDLINVTIDGNDLSVIDSQEFRDSHFKNLKRMHDFAGRDFVPDYQVESLVIDSFPDGTTNTADWRRVDYQETKDTRGYANRVVVRGKRDDAGNYPEAVATDGSEVTAFGDTVTTALITDVETEAAAASQARTELPKRTEQLDLKATLEILARDVKPGYTYTVPALGRDLKLERVTYSDGGGRFTGSLEFIKRITETEQTVSVRSDFDDTQESL